MKCCNIQFILHPTQNKFRFGQSSSQNQRSYLFYHVRMYLYILLLAIEFFIFFAHLSPTLKTKKLC